MRPGGRHRCRHYGARAGGSDDRRLRPRRAEPGGGADRGRGRGGVRTVFSAPVEPNPGTASIERGSRVVRSLGVEGLVVVAVGGGSSMDSAKVIALHATNKRSVLGLG